MHKFLLLISLVCLINCANAQEVEPVKWTYSVKHLSKSVAMLVFDAKIDPKWHMYAQCFPDGGPEKMSFSFTESKDYKKVGKVLEDPKPKTERDKVFEIDVQYFEGRATLSQKIEIKSEKDFIVKGVLEYQACFEDKCVLFTPVFEFKVKGAKKI